MLGTLVLVLVLLFVVGIILALVPQIPPEVKRIGYIVLSVVIAVILIAWVLSVFGHGEYIRNLFGRG